MSLHVICMAREHSFPKQAFLQNIKSNAGGKSTKGIIISVYHCSTPETQRLVCSERLTHVTRHVTPGIHVASPVLVTLQGTGLRHSLRDHDHKIK